MSTLLSAKHFSHHELVTCWVLIERVYFWHWDNTTVVSCFRIDVNWTGVSYCLWLIHVLDIYSYQIWLSTEVSRKNDSEILCIYFIFKCTAKCPNHTDYSEKKHCFTFSLLGTIANGKDDPNLFKSIFLKTCVLKCDFSRIYCMISSKCCQSRGLPTSR